MLQLRKFSAVECWRLNHYEITSWCVLSRRSSFSRLDVHFLSCNWF